MEQFKVGILGAGNIGATMAATLAKMPNAAPYAVASRDTQRAEQFAQKYSMEKAYGSYEELVNDPNVQLIYVATPHSEHEVHARLCLLHDKPVLCEKAFTTNAYQAKSIIDLSQQRKVFLTEAMWTRFLPMTATLQNLINSGIIGKPIMLNSQLGGLLSHKQRMYDPALAGGALLDLGVYTITFASIAFGNDIEQTSSCATFYETGVDANESVLLKYTDGKIATLNNSMCTELSNGGVVYGEEGYIEADVVNNFTQFRVYKFTEGAAKLVQIIDRPAQISGYEYEVDAAISAIQNGKLECEQIPHKLTLQIMELMDSLRYSWGLYYDFEKK